MAGELWGTLGKPDVSVQALADACCFHDAKKKRALIATVVRSMFAAHLTWEMMRGDYQITTVFVSCAFADGAKSMCWLSLGSSARVAPANSIVTDPVDRRDGQLASRHCVGLNSGLKCALVCGRNSHDLSCNPGMEWHRERLSCAIQRGHARSLGEHAQQIPP